MTFHVHFAYCASIILLTNLQNADSASYNGTTALSAAEVLDRSQNAMCEGCSNVGHPRGHASDPTQEGPLDSVENYSFTTRSRKSGFLNRYQQDVVTHFVLRSDRSQRAMSILNNGEYSASLTFELGELPINFPPMRWWQAGVPSSDELDTNEIVIVLRHQEGKMSDPDAEVFVHTVYPKHW